MRQGAPLAAAIAAMLFLGACQDIPLTPDPEAVPTVEIVGVRTGWIFGPGGEPMEVRYEIVGGLSILEGDINLGPAGTVAKTRAELLGRGEGPRHGVVVNGSSYRWGSGVVPYVISSSFNATQRQVILDGMAHIAGNTPGVSFVQRTSQSAYVVFSPHASACNSPVGRQGGAQTINLTSGCAYSFSSVVHEVLHSLGMWHEQSRCDRDTFVIVHYENIEDGKSHNFDKKCTGNSTVFDYGEPSVMHYGRYAFSKNGLPTISSRRGFDHLIGTGSSMSTTDVRTAVWMYPTTPGITYVDWYEWNPIVYWTDTKAVQYTVRLVTLEYWQHVYDGSGSDSWWSTVGTTTATSLQDMNNNSTGRSSCNTSRDSYEQRREEYYYEVVASYGHGVSRTSARTPAYVGRC